MIVNSGVKHSLAASAYNQRRRECETAAVALKTVALCALSPEEFEGRQEQIADGVCRRRARHAIYENRRALDAAEALRRGDLERVGRLMRESHASLRDDYEVSCEELDFLAGLYHPHEKYHHIKRENIGLIEVMGLAVLPSRLQRDLEQMEEMIAKGRDLSVEEQLAKHAAWAAEFVPDLKGKTRNEIRLRLEQELGKAFEQILEDAGVYKCTEEGRAAFRRFIDTL